MTNRKMNAVTKDVPVTTSNATVNYNLPIWEGEDVTSWLTQMNDAMNKIDTGMYENKTDIGNMSSTVEQAQETADNVQKELDGLDTWKQEVDTNVDVALADSAKAKGDAQQAVTGVANANVEIQALQELTDSMQDDISMNAGKITTLETSQAAQDAQIQKNTQDIAALGSAILIAHNTIEVFSNLDNGNLVRLMYSTSIYKEGNFFFFEGIPGALVSGNLYQWIIAKQEAQEVSYATTNPIFTSINNFLARNNLKLPDNTLPLISWMFSISINYLYEFSLTISNDNTLKPHYTGDVQPSQIALIHASSPFITRLEAI